MWRAPSIPQVHQEQETVVYKTFHKGGRLHDITCFYEQKFLVKNASDIVVGIMNDGNSSMVRYTLIGGSSLEIESPVRLSTTPVERVWIPPTPPSTETPIETSRRHTRAISVSPQKKTPLSSCIPARSSPRKRLNLDIDKNIPSPKKFKSESVSSTPLASALESLTSDQLVGLLEKLANENPDVEKRLIEIIPQPDLKPVEEKMRNYRINIQRSLPALSSRLTSKTDSAAYNRVHVHLVDFQKYLEEIGTKLKKSEQWSILLEFIFKAWKNVRSTPIWDNAVHNSIRKRCFRFLSGLLSKTIENSHAFTKEELVGLKDRVELLCPDCQHVDGCLDQLVSMLKN